MNSTSYNYDILILGTGIAGLSCALKLLEKDLKVGLVTRTSEPEQSNSAWAQGGIIFSSDGEDDQASLVEDILGASHQTSSLQASQILAKRSPEILSRVLLEKAQTDFDRDENGELLFTKEAAHSKKRIIYRGDYTGKQIQVSLLNYLKKFETNGQLTFITEHTAIDLITPNHHGVSINQRYEPTQVVGAYLFDQKNEEVKKVMAKKVVLATGGVGGLYIHNSNTSGSRGDGHAMAKRAGARVENMEFIQFHPTTFYSGFGQRRFLISEALRGEGGVLVNDRGESFMHKYHEDLELAPRDVVSRAIWSEMIETGSDYVYLDMRSKSEDWFKNRFPTIYHYCCERHVNPSHDLIPVVPAAHYTCGGVYTDLNGRTDLTNLYAVGEVACNGLHGANRLASTSLLEGLTFGHIAAEDICETIEQSNIYDASSIKDWTQGTQEVDLALVAQDTNSVKQTMWNYLGLIRSKSRLARARAMFRELSDEISKFYKHAKLHDELIGLRNSIDVAFMVLNASMKNQESVGCFYLEDGHKK